MLSFFFTIWFALDKRNSLEHSFVIFFFIIDFIRNKNQIISFSSYDIGSVVHYWLSIHWYLRRKYDIQRIIFIKITFILNSAFKYLIDSNRTSNYPFFSVLFSKLNSSKYQITIIIRWFITGNNGIVIRNRPIINNGMLLLLITNNCPIEPAGE